MCSLFVLSLNVCFGTMEINTLTHISTCIHAHNIMLILTMKIFSFNRTEIENWINFSHCERSLSFRISEIFIAASPVTYFSWLNRFKYRSDRQFSLEVLKTEKKVLYYPFSTQSVNCPIKCWKWKTKTTKRIDNNSAVSNEAYVIIIFLTTEFSTDKFIVRFNLIMENIKKKNVLLNCSLSKLLKTIFPRNFLFAIYAFRWRVPSDNWIASRCQKRKCAVYLVIWEFWTILNLAVQCPPSPSSNSLLTLDTLRNDTPALFVGPRTHPLIGWL